MKERKYSTTVQMRDKQLIQLDAIIQLRKNKPSMSEIMREAFDFYVQEKYPKLVNLEG